MKSEEISLCRLCAGETLLAAWTLGQFASCGVFPAAHDSDAPSAPLELVQCADCKLVQLRHDFSGEDLFRQTYGYRSGLNESMVRHLRSIAQSAISRTHPKADEIALDIGSNDGTLLSQYDAPGLRRIGIDPTSARFARFYPAGALACDDFFNAGSYRALAGDSKAKIISSVSMFYDLPNPNAFTADIKAILAPDGLWVLEQSYLPTMAERNSFDTICHEHLEYYGLNQIERLLIAHGLRVADVTLNEVNGGSFQVWACHADAPYSSNIDAIARLKRKESAEGYETLAPLLAMRDRVEKIRGAALKFLHGARAQGKLVHGYGASTKGNTTLQYFGVTPDLMPAIAERNEEKFGCRTPGTNIPIISEKESRAASPDYYFVLPWHFRQGFIEREQAFLARGGRFVFPLPQLEIISA